MALGLCSEEVVTLGIMRIAEELHHQFPDSVVVIQGILPRSNHRDGSLDGKTSKYASRTPGQRQGGDRHTLFKHGSHLRDGAPGGGAKGGEKKPTRGVAGTGYNDAMNPFGAPGGRNLLDEDGEFEEDAMMIFNDDVDADIDNYNRHLEEAKTREEKKEAREKRREKAKEEARKEAREKANVEAKEEFQEETKEEVKQEELKFDKKKGTDKLGDQRARQPKFDYYLWPSIQAINKQLEGFCGKHEHLVYFDGDDLLLGSVGNDHYRVPHRTIIRDLMPNYVHLSYLGHKVVIDVLNDELKRIIFEDDETNDVEKKSSSGGKRGKR